MNQSSPQKESTLVVDGAGAFDSNWCSGFGILGGKSDAENHRKYQQQKEEIAKRHALNKAE